MLLRFADFYNTLTFAYSARKNLTSHMLDLSETSCKESITVKHVNLPFH